MASKDAAAAVKVLIFLICAAVINTGWTFWTGNRWFSTLLSLTLDIGKRRVVWSVLSGIPQWMENTAQMGHGSSSRSILFTSYTPEWYKVQNPISITITKCPNSSSLFLCFHVVVLLNSKDNGWLKRLNFITIEPSTELFACVCLFHFVLHKVPLQFTARPGLLEVHSGNKHLDVTVASNPWCTFVH